MIRRILGGIIVFIGLFLILPPLFIFGVGAWEWIMDGFRRFPMPDSLHVQGIDRAFVGWEIIAVCGGFCGVGVVMIWFGWSTMTSHKE